MVSTPNDVEMLDADSADDDNLSLTSTIVDEINSDEEWTAEGIIAEGRMNGVKHWLVEWTGYPLAEATWEPRAHVQGQLLRTWRKRKARQERGEEERFDLNIWRNALSEQLRAKYARHEKRNEKRLRMGLAPTTWEQPVDELLELTLDFYPEFETRDESSGEEDMSSRDDDDDDGNDDEKGRNQERPDNDASNSMQVNPLRTTEPDHDMANKQRPQKPFDESQRIHPPSSTSISGNAQTPGPEPAPNLPLASAKSSLPDAAPNPTKELMPKASNIPLTAASAPTRPVPNSVYSQPAQSKKNNSTSNTEGWSNSLSRSGNDKPTGLKSRGNRIINTMGGGVPVNVFAGGSTRKARPTLLDAASDTSKEPKLVNLRQQRIIQQGRRNKEDVAPAQIPKRLISLDPKVRAGDLDIGQPTRSLEIPPFTKPKNSIEASQNPPTLSATSPTYKGQDNETAPRPRTLKRKKSVRFDDSVTYQEPTYVESETEPFAFEDSRFSHLPQEDQDNNSPLEAAGSTFRPPTPPRNTHVASPQPWTSKETRSVTKRCMFGPKSIKHIDIIFKNIPEQTSHPWLSEFMHCAQIVFGQVCIAPDFSSQSQNLRQGQNLASGSLLCPTGHSEFENLAKRLNMASKGVMCYSERYCILIYPAMCTDWDFELVPSHNAGNLLKFIIFEPTPLMHKDSFARKSSQESQALPRGVSHFLQLDSNRLVPQLRLNQSVQSHNVFIAFPTPSRVQEARFISTWLRVSTKIDLHVYSASIPGDWASFRGTGTGTIIIHEDVISKIRLFPEIAEMMRETGRNGNYAVFIFQQALAQFCRFPSSVQKSQVGDIILYRILPSHKVLMMTPSFILSQPQQAYDFVRWFKNDLLTNRTSYRSKLAVCSDVNDWVRQLATGEAVTRQNRVRSQDIQAWLNLWQQLEDLMAKSAKEGDTNSFLVFAPEGIDGSDEQSLVNWFGSWTVNYLDTASRFFVLGSNCNEVSRMTRKMKILEYADDADEDQPGVAREAALDAASQLLDVTISQTPSVSNPQGVISAPTGPKGALQLIENDSASAIRSHLQMLNQRCYSLALIYNRPVAYWHTDMPWHFGDISSEFAPYSYWFSFFNTLNFDTKAKNTYMGFFYTVTNTWKSDEAVADRTPIRDPARRPWIAIFRPREPHKRPWRSTELLIWDPGYSKKFLNNPRIYERDLIEAQQELIKLVAQENRLKNPSLPFDKVWLAGRDRSFQSEYSHPLDVCLDTLEAFGSELRTWLPSPKEKMPGRGWRCVEENAWPVEEIQPSIMDEKRDDEPDQKLNIIFHPPPGRQLDRPSHCENLLYREVMRAASQPSSDGNFTYRFPPTHEWYSRQQEEDRGFSHIYVESWKKIFSMLQIKEGKHAKQADTTSRDSE
ncbi:unnamed protein product [Clonostachys chloroleuca]|uniref:Chromo domain-containing protein n=1 Tax=Clonostachys chloroleuca TaxID=1926264 RepID=A0AA35M9G1_9HYPO|nr:unnamed protein product [Clonostachys chloroleuca]